MKTFNIYKHPVQGVEAVKVGFSWPAFFFGFIWMLIKKLWLLAIVWFGLTMVLSFIENLIVIRQPADSQVFSYALLAICYIALWLLPGFKGNAWRESNLLKRGYQKIISLNADNPDAAVAQFVQAQPPVPVHEVRPDITN